MQTTLRTTIATASALIAAFALAVPAVATPKNPTPKPISEARIKSECQDPDLGGVYGTTMVGNDRKSTCDYLSGGEYCSDEYINGVFQNTVCGRTNPTAPGATRPAPAQAPSISSP